MGANNPPPAPAAQSLSRTPDGNTKRVLTGIRSEFGPVARPTATDGRAQPALKRRRSPAEGFDRGADLGKLAREVGDDDDIRAVVGDQAIALLTVGQGFGRLLSA